MVGMTLVEIRERVESLESDDGDYYVVCGRTGEQPVPVVGKRFDTRTAAESAARAAEQYRAELRRYDPRVQYYDLIVCEASRTRWTAETRRADDRDWSLSDPVLRGASPDGERRELVEFCHRVAAAVFETLSEAGYGSTETAVMDAYVELAERIADPDELCLCLLETMSNELDERLDPDEQADVIDRAASRLPRAEPSDRPVAATLARLRRLGLLGGFTRSPQSVDLDDGSRSVVVRLREYAFSPREGRLPVLPIALDLHRRRPDLPPSALTVVDADDGWRVRIVLANDGEPEGLASSRIRAEG